ncbi:MAG: hypothetical protein HN370_02645 [Phycisphaerales bacterium]|jgi:hypothetical protein|nr:hypothetical protein [Phycisphaerales bacterium]
MELKSKICLWLILLGLGNLFAYTVTYSVVGGESVRGKIVEDPATGERHYFLDKDVEVSRGEFIFMGVHSISVWVSIGAIMLAMLTLAKDNIADSLKNAAMRGRTLCTVLAVLIGVCVGVQTFRFIDQFSAHFRDPAAPTIPPAPATPPTATSR